MAAALLYLSSIAALAYGQSAPATIGVCSADDNTITKEAVLCNDVLPEYCASTGAKAHYASAGTFVPAKEGNADNLIPTGCYSGGDVGTEDLTVDENFVKAAIKTCPKRCGFCCKTPEYDCEEADNPKIKCSTVTQAQCADANWRELIAESCPNKCGFCLLGGCIDAAVDCDKDSGICTRNDPDTQAFVKENCKRTCGFCVSGATNTTTASPNTTCKDTHLNCASWVANGFCTSTFYTDAMKKEYCSASCRLC